MWTAIVVGVTCRTASCHVDVRCSAVLSEVRELNSAVDLSTDPADKTHRETPLLYKLTLLVMKNKVFYPTGASKL